ncbi:hypothetical protein D9M73_137100 [compost metagenome]
MLLQFAQQLGLEAVITVAQGGTGNFQTLAQHLGQVQFKLASAHQADDHPAPVTGQQLEVQLTVASADRVENHIERAETFQRVQVLVTYHTTRSAQRLAVGQAVLRTDADPYRAAERLAQLDGGRANATGAGVHQHLLASLHCPELEDVQPGGGIHLRQRCRLMQAKAFGYRQYVTGIDHHFLGHGAAGQQGANAVTHAPGGTSPHLFNHPGTLQPHVWAGTWWWRVQTFHLQQVGAVQPCSGHANAHLARVTGRAFGLDPLHMSVNALQCLHSASIVES